VKKWANELNRTFSKEEVQMVKKKKKLEEISNIPGHKGNANLSFFLVVLGFELRASHF
jgi:hypothetical protein